ARSAAFYKLYNEKRKAKAKLPALEPVRKRGEEQFRAGNVAGIIQALAEGTALLQGQPWEERQRFVASLTLETDCLVLEPNQDLHLSLQRIFPTDSNKAFPDTPTVTFLIVPGGDRQGSSGSSGAPAAHVPAPIALSERIPIGESQAGAARK